MRIKRSSTAGSIKFDSRKLKQYRGPGKRLQVLNSTSEAHPTSRMMWRNCIFHVRQGQASKLTLASSHFASGLHQTGSAKLYHMHFSVTRISALKMVLISSSDFILASRSERHLLNFASGLKVNFEPWAGLKCTHCFSLQENTLASSKYTVTTLKWIKHVRLVRDEMQHSVSVHRKICASTKYTVKMLKCITYFTLGRVEMHTVFQVTGK